jgi:hypothetical protein
MERSKDLRTMMKKFAPTASSSVREEKERIRLLRMNREHKLDDKAYNPESPTAKSPSLTSNNILVNEGHKEKPKYKVATLTPSIFALVQSSKGEHLNPATRKGSGSDQGGMLEVSNEFERDSVSGLPPGFFDNAFEDMEARGLEVKEELLKKDQKSATELQSFFGEVEQALANVESSSSEDEMEDTEEMAVQLAYAAKTAGFLAVSRAALVANSEKGKPLNDQTFNQGVRELDLMIASFTGEDIRDGQSVSSSLKRDKWDMASDVAKILEKKRQKIVISDPHLSNSCNPFDYCTNWTAKSYN